MIQEIINFIDYVEGKSPEIFSDNLELKEGVYVFLEKEDDELVVKEENVFKVGKDTERNQMYENFLILVTNTEMLNAMKSFNSGPKVYITIGSPFGIALNAKAYKGNAEIKLLTSAEAYFRAARKYMDAENEQHEKWCQELEYFVKTKMLDFLASNEEYGKAKDQFMFYFFMKEPQLSDYQEIQNRFLSEKLFNKDKFNVKNDSGELYGISDALSGFNDKKEFLKHKTSTIELNYRVSGQDAKKIYQFFRLQQKNEILPNPFPLFVDEEELSDKAIKFYKKNKKYGHKEIIEELLRKKKKDLQNYYLIYFHNGQKGSRIVDLDFVPVFRYKVDDIKLEEPFSLGGKFRSLPITNIFEFQQNILNKILNEQLIVPKKNGSLWIRHFDDMEAKPEYGYATDAIVDLFYMYRKAFYDYVYKSRREAITRRMFHDMIQKSIIDDIRHDKDHNKTYRIKEKLNIWFNLYNYFNNNQNTTNMASKIPELLDRCKLIANTDGEHLSDDPKEFAFAAGQIIYFLLSKSEGGNKTHAMLEPFLQKVKAAHLQMAISNLIGVYKHAINFGRGRFERLAKEVLAYETDVNMKEMQRFVLAGYFAEPVIYEKSNEEQHYK